MHGLLHFTPIFYFILFVLVIGLFGHFKFQVSSSFNLWVGDYLVQETNRDNVIVGLSLSI